MVVNRKGQTNIDLLGGPPRPRRASTPVAPTVVLAIAVCDLLLAPSCQEDVALPTKLTEAIGAYCAETRKLNALPTSTETTFYPDIKALLTAVLAARRFAIR